MATIGYIRVSTQQQDGQGQRAELEAHAELSAVYQDTCSGATPGAERPGFISALAALGKGDVLLVARRDRLGRDALDVAMIERLIKARGARIETVTGLGADETPEAQLIIRVLDLVSEYEKALNNARTKAALDARRADGLVVGQAPLGVAKDEGGRAVPCAREEALIQRARQLRAEGAIYREIQTTMHAEGYRSRRGGRVSVDTLRKACAGISAPRRAGSGGGGNTAKAPAPGMAPQAREMQARGLSLCAIARALTEQGYTTKTGGAISAMQVKRLLARP